MSKRKKKSVSVFTLIFLLTSTAFSFAQEGYSAENRKKRDPFVALVNTNGKIKSDDELFPASMGKRPLSLNVVLNAIIWDDKRPLAMINNKIYSEGKDIGGIILEKINPNSVVLNDKGNLVTVELRKLKK